MQKERAVGVKAMVTGTPGSGIGKQSMTPVSREG